MGYSKSASDLYENIFEECLKLKPGEEIYVPCGDKNSQGSIKTKLYGIRKRYEKVSEVEAEKIVFSTATREGKKWIRCSRRSDDPGQIFKKTVSETGEEKFTQLEVGNRTDRARQIALMREDGYTMEEINETLKKEGDLEK